MNGSPRVLLVDDDPGVREAMSAFLCRAGYAVEVAECGEKALAHAAAAPCDIVVSDLKMPGMTGIELLESLRRRGISIPFILLTAYGSVQTAVAAMKSGAADFLLKPFLPAQLERTLRSCLSSPSAPAGGIRDPEGDGMVAHSPGMREILSLARHVARGNATVLVTGESGTGKEVLARYLHGHSGRPSAPFVAVNCAAIPEGLLESELFGYEKGAFTGAAARKAGKFEAADGGTLLLDEIGEMDLRLQAKLLRVLQERTFERVGGTSPVSVRLRIVATTNRNLREEIARGRFREDLFHRLNVVPIALPPLRERTEDILPIAERYAAIRSEEYGTPTPAFTEEARNLLLSLPYPGNVRELMNRVERAVLAARGGAITPELLADPGEASRAAAVSPPPVFGSVRDAEKSLILSTLRRTGGNRSRAAAELGISVRTLRNKIRGYRAEGEEIP
ncbi:MAG: sigma-54 dependent transcriptional regulator [Deltaproteobacteria bacterium]